MLKDTKNTCLLNYSYNNHNGINTRALKTQNGVTLSKGQYLAMLKRQENTKHKINLRNTNTCTPNNIQNTKVDEHVKSDTVDKLFSDRTSLVNKKIQKSYNTELNQKQPMNSMKNNYVINHSGSRIQNHNLNNYSSTQSFTHLSKNIYKSKKEN